MDRCGRLDRRRDRRRAEQAGKHLRLGLEALGVAFGLGERLTCDVEGLARRRLRRLSAQRVGLGGNDRLRHGPRCGGQGLIERESGDELTLTKDGHADRGFAGPTRPDRNAVGRQWLFQRGECTGVRGRQHRAADCDRAAGTSSLLARAICRHTTGAREPHAGRGDGLAAAETLRASSSTPCASRPRNRFGIIKSVMGFRQFLLRGLVRVRGEWSLVTMSWNIKRMYALSLG
jgi:hypothetical protein